MKNIFCLVVFFLCFKSSTAQTWTKTTLNDKVTIEFPSIAEIEEDGNKKFHQIIHSDYIINVATIDLSKNSNFNIRAEQLDDFYRGVINGSLEAATNSKLTKQKKIKIGKYEGREVEYTKDFNGISNIKVVKRILLVEKSLFSFELWNMSETNLKKLTQRFFKSIVVQ